MKPNPSRMDKYNDSRERKHVISKMDPNVNERIVFIYFF